VNNDVIEEEFSTTGAYVMGRRMADAGLIGWGDEPPFRCPVFVVTHRTRDSFDKGGTLFTFVDSVEEAVSRARKAAGDKDAAVVGGVSVVRQALMAGLVDQLDVHVAPVLLGRGVRLFEPTDLLQNGQGIELTPTRVLSQDDVTHLRYEVGGAQLLTDDDF
jgi:dihydrofolate reductase